MSHALIALLWASTLTGCTATAWHLSRASQTAATRALRATIADLHRQISHHTTRADRAEKALAISRPPNPITERLHYIGPAQLTQLTHEYGPDTALQLGRLMEAQEVRCVEGGWYEPWPRAERGGHILTGPADTIRPLGWAEPNGARPFQEITP